MKRRSTPVGQERRRAYRVPFEDQGSPVLVLADHEYQVSEVASGGLRITKETGDSLAVGQTHRALLRFPSGKSYPVRGTILRDLGEELVFEFIQEIPSTEFNRRSFHRVDYPEKLRPILEMGEKKYEVVDLSEYGVCIEVDSSSTFEQDQEVAGVVLLRDGGTLEVEGKVQRMFGKRVAFQLDESVPLDLIVKEQRLLNRIYGAHSPGSLRQYFEENIGFVAFQYFFGSTLEGEERIQRLHEIAQERGVEHDIFELRDRVETLCEEKTFRKDQAVQVAFDVLQWRNRMTDRS